jgi:hypothetical protein
MSKCNAVVGFTLPYYRTGSGSGETDAIPFRGDGFANNLNETMLKGVTMQAISSCR